jgi:hypothetical protein
MPGFAGSSSERTRPSLLLALVLAACAAACNGAPTPSASAAVSEPAATPSAAVASARPSPTNDGRIVTFYNASDQRIDPVNGLVTVCDFSLRGTIFDYRSGVAYSIAPVSPADRPAYYDATQTDVNGSWRSPVISLTDGEWRLTVQGALTHPDQTYAIRVACPDGRTPTPSPVPTIKPLAGAGQPTLLELFAQGRMTGKVAWVTKVAQTGSGGGGVARSWVLELWAVPLDRSAPRLAVRYRSTHVTGSSDTNLLRRQFSPDGRRIVLSVATGPGADGHGLAVIDLEAGRVVTMIGGASEDEIDPAWSPDGTRLAFVRPASSEPSSEIWIVAPDGSAARRLRAGTRGTPNHIYGWTPDSKKIGFAPVYFERAAYALIDLNGVESGQSDRLPNGPDPIDWRARTPGFAEGITDSPYTPQRSNIIVADGPAGAPRIVADVVVNPNDNTVTGVRSPRWDPSGRDRLIYLEDGVQGSFVLADISFVTTTTKQAGGRVALAEWMPDGSAIVTLEEHPSTAPLSVYVYDAEARLQADRLFLSNTDTTYRLSDLAPRGY